MNIRNIYVYDPNGARFIAGPFQCPNVANAVMREKQPQFGTPEREPYVIVEMATASVLGHQLRKLRGKWLSNVEHQMELALGAPSVPSQPETKGL